MVFAGAQRCLHFCIRGKNSYENVIEMQILNFIFARKAAPCKPAGTNTRTQNFHCVMEEERCVLSPGAKMREEFQFAPQQIFVPKRQENSSTEHGGFSR
jgi:hypothetical protein